LVKLSFNLSLSRIRIAIWLMVLTERLARRH